MSIKFAIMTIFLWRERMESIMKCERSIITTTLLRLDYLVHSLDNCADDTSTETGLSCWIQNLSRKGSKNPSLFFFWSNRAIPLTLFSNLNLIGDDLILIGDGEDWGGVVFRFLRKHINNARTKWGFLNASIRLTINFNFDDIFKVKLCFYQATNFGSWIEIGHIMTRLQPRE